jgi:hypothetical protein
MAAAIEHEAKRIVGKRARQEIADFVDENIKQLVARLWELAAATKKAWGTCPRCSCRVEVEVPDTHGAVKALEALVNQGYGRPQPETADGEGGITVIRRIIVPDASEEDIAQEVERRVAAELKRLADAQEPPRPEAA